MGGEAIKEMLSRINIMVGEIIQNLMSLAGAIGGFVFTTIRILIFIDIPLIKY